MRIIVPRIRELHCRRAFCRVPPSPGLLLQLYVRYQSLVETRRLPQGLTFEQFFAVWSSSRRCENFVGLDDGSTSHGPSTDDQDGRETQSCYRNG